MRERASTEFREYGEQRSGRKQTPRIPQSPRLDQKGMALLITVMTVSLLVAVTIQYYRTTWQQFLVSNNYRVGSQLQTIADSGVNIAMALLQADGEDNGADSLLEDWAEFSKESFAGTFSAGSLLLKVNDQSGRLQINSLVNHDSGASGEEEEGIEVELRRILLRLLLSGSFSVESEEQARSIVDALVDWIDKDDQETDLGAESGYYQSLDTPYSCRNGSVQYIEELLFVKGITPELLFGGQGRLGLADFLTVHGDDGKVNLNTAPLLLVKSFSSQIEDDLLVTFDEYRKDEANEERLAALAWYQEVDGWPGYIVIDEALQTTASSYFQIVATGEFDNFSRTVRAVVERSDEGEVRLLGKKME